MGSLSLCKFESKLGDVELVLKNLFKKSIGKVSIPCDNNYILLSNIVETNVRRLNL